jgi:DNA-binding Lrp family transcriptional regulator
MRGFFVILDRRSYVWRTKNPGGASMNWELHPATQKVLDYLQDQKRRNRKPTMQEVADKLGLRRIDVINRVIKLRRMGYIKPPKPAQRSRPVPMPPKIPKKVIVEPPARDDQVLETCETPPKDVHELLKLESFRGSIWDPACGKGEMAAILKKKFGRQRVRATDIASGVDFLKSDLRADAIISHPPPRLSKEFVAAAQRQANKKVALWLELCFLEEARRAGECGMGLKNVYIPNQDEASKKIFPTEKYIPEMLSMAWFVWEKGYEGADQLHWL